MYMKVSAVLPSDVQPSLNKRALRTVETGRHFYPLYDHVQSRAAYNVCLGTVGTSSALELMMIGVILSWCELGATLG